MAPRAPPPPAPSAKVPTATRRARRVIESVSPTPSHSASGSGSGSATPTPPVQSRRGKRPAPISEPEEEDDNDDEVEEEEEDEGEDGDGEELEEEEEEEGVELDDEQDAEGEELESEDEGAGPLGVSSVIASEDMDIDDSGSTSPPPSTSGSTATGPKSALKIKLNMPSISSTTPTAGRQARGAAKKSAKRTKQAAAAELVSDDELLLLDDDDFEDQLDLASRRSNSPTKMTARQRAKGNKDLQETLLQLPDDMTGKKAIVLTEAEKQQKREEIARRRKRQSEQKLQDEQDQTINRLLRAQTSKSRSKLDNPSPALDPTDLAGTSNLNLSPGRRAQAQAPAPKDAIRWISSMHGEGVSIRVAVPEGKEDWLAFPSSDGITRTGSEKEKEGKRCGVQGCGERRKYRSVKEFERGACSLEHLKVVEAAL